MFIMFYGIYGMENIKTINKYRAQLEDPESFNDYDSFKKILYEIDSNREEPPIYAEYKSNNSDFFATKKHVNWFIENKCNWRNQQYRLDRYYKIRLDMAMEVSYMIIVVLKQIMYVEGHDKIRIMKLKSPVDMIQTSIPDNLEVPNLGSGFDFIDEKSDEFQDAYIVVRK